jgi:hypothetical protein
VNCTQCIAAFVGIRADQPLNFTRLRLGCFDLEESTLRRAKGNGGGSDNVLLLSDAWLILKRQTGASHAGRDLILLATDTDTCSSGRG